MAGRKERGRQGRKDVKEEKKEGRKERERGWKEGKERNLTGPSNGIKELGFLCEQGERGTFGDEFSTFVWEGMHSRIIFATLKKEGRMEGWKDGRKEGGRKEGRKEEERENGKGKRKR
jgi:hypothetical protein